MRDVATSLVALCIGSLLGLACSDSASLTSGSSGTGGGGGVGGAVRGTGGGLSGAGGIMGCPPCVAPPTDCPYGLLPGNGPCGCGATCAPGPGDSDAAASACQWPAALDPSDASTNGQCRAARAFVTCQDSTGAGQGCLSNDPTACPDIPVGASVTRSCQDQCNANEYGAACGSVGPSTAPFPTPPSGCRMLVPTPAGIAFYCCPCI